MWELDEFDGNDRLGFSLTNGLIQYLKENEIPTGIYAGWDPARKNDRSALIFLEKALPTYDNPAPKLRCQMMRDLSLNEQRIKGVGFLKQANKIVNLDKKRHISNLVVDATSNQDAVYEYLQRHFEHRVEPVEFTKTLKAQWIQAVRIAFQEELLEFNPKQQYFQILRTELYELDPEKLKHPEKGTDDFVWALALAIKATNVLNYRKGVDSGFSADELIF